MTAFMTGAGAKEKEIDSLGTTLKKETHLFDAGKITGLDIVKKEMSKDGKKYSMIIKTSTEKYKKPGVETKLDIVNEDGKWFFHSFRTY
jgi:hypothetical protein